MLRNFWRTLFRRRDRQGIKGRRRSPRPEPTPSHVARWIPSHGLCQAAESLESRALLATITVTSLLDNTTVDGQVTLREAIQAANTDTTVDGVSGSGADTIQFASALTASGPATIRLGGTELAITSDMSILGPGADRLAIDGNQTSRIFNVSDGNNSLSKTVFISGLTITNGRASSGGGIANAENLTLRQATVSRNRSSVSGGGIGNEMYRDSIGMSVTVDQCSIIDNESSAATGGGIANYYGSLTILRSNISGNVARGSGGAGVQSGYGVGTLIIANSTISGNVSYGSGGGIRAFAPDGGSQTIDIRQSTISGNVSSSRAGAIDAYASISLKLTQCTVVGNSTNGSSGGIYADFSKATFTNSIIAGNTLLNGTANDLGSGTLSSASRNNIIGDPNHAAGLINGVNGNIVGNGSGGVIDLSTVLNTVLADNGGPTMTHALASGSPAINSGNNSLIPADTSDLDGDGVTLELVYFDQRGIGFSRMIGGTVDIGAFESDTTASETTDSDTTSTVQPIVTVSLSPPSLAEDGSGNLIFTLTRDLTSGLLTVNFGLSGTATLDEDYFADVPTSVVFADGASTATLTVDPTADSTVEPDEAMVLTLANSPGYQVGTSNSATGTILNDDGSSTLSISSWVGANTDGDVANTGFTFRAARDGSLGGPASVDYVVTGSGANPANAADFGGSFPSGTITFEPGETERYFTINASSDSTVEPDEEFAVTLLNPVGGSLGWVSTTGIILSDDSSLSITSANASQSEGNSGSTPFTFTVTRTGDTRYGAWANFVITGSGINAANAADFGGTLPSGSVFFGAGETQQTITVDVMGDSVSEPDEGFIVTLSNPSGTAFSGAFLGTSTATGSILNDDSSITLSITATDASKAEGNSGNTAFMFTVTRTGSTSGTAIANFAVTGSGTNAASASDFGGALPSGTVSFAAGETSKTITLNVSGDTTSEADEGFSVTLSNVTGASLGTATAPGTILNDDSSPNTYVVDTLVDESDGNFSAGDFSLREAIGRANATAGTQTILFASSLTASGPATITLGGTELAITSDLTINGPGADRLTIDGNQTSRIFNVTDGNSSSLKTVLISGLTITNGRSSGSGGGIYNSEILTLRQATVSRNTTSVWGGGIQSGTFSNGGVGTSLTVDQCSIIDNQTPKGGGGGGISSVGGYLTILRSNISRNVAESAGGIFSYLGVGTITIANTTISENISENTGGGIRVDPLSGTSQTLKIHESTISGNLSNGVSYAGGRGGGIFAYGGVSLELTQCTVIGNSTTGPSGGINADFSKATFTNSIIAGNTLLDGTPNDLGGGTLSSASRNNIIGDPNHAAGLINGVNGNIVGNGSGGLLNLATVLNLNLADNGGPWPTHAFVSGSPAINAGNNSLIPADMLDLDGDSNLSEAVPFDQRGNGFSRIVAGTVDIGAVEDGATYTPPPSVTIAVSPAAVTEDGSGNLVFTLTRDVTTGPLTVNFSLSGSAISGTDYLADLTNSVTFADGASTATVTVDPTTDSGIEGNETVVLTVTSGTGYLIGSTSTATGTILNDEASLSIAATSASTSEGNSGNTAFTFTVTRSGSTSGTASANFAVMGSGANAANASDFGGTLPNGSVNFAVGETTKTITVNVSGDSSAEPDEGFTVTLSNATGATLDAASANLVINGDFEAGNTGFSTAYSYNSANVPLGGQYAITSDPRLVHSGFASYVDHTPGSGTLMLVANGTTTPAAVWEQTVAVAPNTTYQFAAYGSTTVHDTAQFRFEINGTIVGTLSVPAVTGQWTRFSANWNSGTATSANLKIINTSVAWNGNDFALDDISFGVGTSLAVATGTILNDDASGPPQPRVTVAVSPDSASEDGSDVLVFTLTRDQTNGTLTVNVALSGTATSGSDYSADATNSVGFADGESTATVTVDPTADFVFENDETVVLTVTGGTGYEAGAASAATATVLNDDALALLSIGADSATKREGNSGSTPFTFTVTRTGNAHGTVSANYAVRGSGSNPAATADFGGSLPSGTISFADGETSKTITINVSGNKSVEPDEDFTVTLSNVVGANLGTAAATGTILNDDAALSIAATDANKLEGNSGETSFTFTVTRTGDPSETATVDFVVAASGSQPADAVDFGGALPSGTLSFAAGETSKNLVVNVSGDSEIESDESFAVTLSNAVGANFGTASATGVILSEELPPSLSISAAGTSQDEGHSDSTSFEFTVTRTGDASGVSSVDFAITGSGTNAANADDFGGTLPNGTITFAAGETEQTILVTVTGDTELEPDEGFTITLSNVVGADLGTSSATGTILSDDTLLSIAAGSASKSEGNSGNTAFTFTVTRLGNTSGEASVNYAVTGSGDDSSDGSERSDTSDTTDMSSPSYSTYVSDATDFGGTLPSGTISFAAGESSKTISINVSGDTTVEPDEGFSITLSNPSGAILGTSSATGTILNDDTSLSTANGLVSWWKADGNTSDSAGGNDGVLQGDAAFQSAVINQGFQFDGNGDYVAVPFDASFDFAPSGQFTIELWANPGRLDRYQALLVKSPSNTAWDWGVYLESDHFMAGLHVQHIVRSATVLNVDTWYHVAVTYDNGNWKLYVNGVLESESFGTFITQSTGGLSLGQKGEDAYHHDYFMGLLDDARLSNRALTAEQIAVTLSNATGADLGTSSATGTILNDDASLAIAAADASKPEGHSGNTPFTFTVTRTGNTSIAASANYAVTASGTGAVGTESQPTAANGGDFGGTLPSGTINFAAGDTTRTITLNVTGDTTAELDEGFTVTLSNAMGATLGTPSATGTIVNDDASLSIAATEASKSEGNSGDTPFTFTVTRTGDTSGAASANFVVTGSGANGANADDFGGTLPSSTIDFAAGETTKTIILSVSSDPTVEADEGFKVTLSNVAGAGLGTASATGTILNDDARLSIVAESASKAEGSSGNTAFTFTVIRTGDTRDAASVDVTVSGGGISAADDADFEGGLLSGTVQFAAGETRQAISVNVQGDSTAESDEGFSVALANPQGADLETSSAAGTIIDDDRPVVRVTIDRAGRLSLIENGPGQSDDLVVSFEPSSDEFVIASPVANLLPLDGLTITNEVHVAASQVTSGLFANLGGGDNRLNLGAISLRTTVLGGTGNDSIMGSQSDDFIDAGRGEDFVNGGSGRDVLLGGGGNDVLLGGSQEDSLNGGDGNDQLDGQGGSGDVVNGDAGNDTLRGGAGVDAIRGGDGIDTFVERQERVASPLTIALRDTQVTGLNATGEAETLASVERALIELGSGNDRLDASAFTGSVTLLGGLGNDTLIGGHGDDVLQGQQGHDVLDGRHGNDRVQGGNGRDRLQGGESDDTLEGGLGQDTLLGGDGDDSLRGGDGADWLLGEAGLDVVNGDNGPDRLTGGGNGIAHDPGDQINDTTAVVDEAFSFNFDSLLTGISGR